MNAKAPVATVISYDASECSKLHIDITPEDARALAVGRVLRFYRLADGSVTPTMSVDDQNGRAPEMIEIYPVRPGEHMHDHCPPLSSYDG